jgi:hypothetical protein
MAPGKVWFLAYRQDEWTRCAYDMRRMSEDLNVLTYTDASFLNLAKSRESPLLGLSESLREKSDQCQTTPTQIELEVLCTMGPILGLG